MFVSGVVQITIDAMRSVSEDVQQSSSHVVLVSRAMSF